MSSELSRSGPFDYIVPHAPGGLGMAIVKPFVTAKFTSYAGDVLTAKVLLALRLVDDFLRLEDVNAIQRGREKLDFDRENPVGNVNVGIKGPREISVVKNNSGFYCVVLFEADPGKLTTVPTQWSSTPTRISLIATSRRSSALSSRTERLIRLFRTIRNNRLRPQGSGC